MCILKTFPGVNRPTAVKYLGLPNNSSKILRHNFIHCQDAQTSKNKLKNIRSSNTCSVRSNFNVKTNKFWQRAFIKNRDLLYAATAGQEPDDRDFESGSKLLTFVGLVLWHFFTF